MTTADPAQLVTGNDIDEQAYVPQSAPPPPSALIRLSSAGDVYRNLANIRTKDREHFVAFFLNVRHRVIRRRTIAIGTLTGVDCHPREVFKPAIACAAAAIIVAHNHPSNDPTPSRADLDLTTRLREAGELVGIPLLDHVVVCADGFISLAERNWR
jgi:DNA repair protein RadC